MSHIKEGDIIRIDRDTDRVTVCVNGSVVAETSSPFLRGDVVIDVVAGDGLVLSPREQWSAVAQSAVAQSLRKWRQRTE